MRDFFFLGLGTIFTMCVFWVPSFIFYRPEYFFSFVVVICGFVFGHCSALRTFRVEASLIVALALFGTFAVFMQPILGKPFVPADAMIVLRYLFYFVALMFGAVIAEKSGIKTVIWFVAPIFVAAVIISVLQYKNIFGINRFLVPFYANNNELLLHQEYWRRTVGTYGNPNYWGLLIGTLSMFLYARLLWKGHLWLVAVLPIVAYCLLLSGSRAAMVGTGVAITAGALLVSTWSRARPNLFAVMLIVLGVLVVVSFRVLNLKEVGYENPARLTNMDSWYLRLHYWAGIVGQVIESSPLEIIFGRGPVKQTSIVYGDNMFILLLRDYGVIGVLLYVSLLMRMIVRTMQYAKQTMSQHVNLDVAALALLLIAFGVFDLTADGWFNVRITPLFLFLYGFILTKALLTARDNRPGSPLEPRAAAIKYANLYHSA